MKQEIEQETSFQASRDELDKLLERFIVLHIVIYQLMITTYLKRKKLERNYLQ